jgi:hypothetical protein
VAELYHSIAIREMHVDFRPCTCEQTGVEFQKLRALHRRGLARNESNRAMGRIHTLSVSFTILK